MKDDLFNELVRSVREGGAILRGEAEPSRTFVVDGPNIKRLRATYRLSQTKFAALFGISVGTLRNWEQGRRTPEGPARVLLQVAAKHPRAVWKVVQAASPRLRQAAKAQRPAKKRTHRPTTIHHTQARRSARAT
jgi:putative transcriptional regulator